ncbi:polysaccharide deacetylase family protein [Salipaludibacillus daqingensis]|uniref:polysaccharide deacetylase family protein n=1 Tax=Salipaludibacillus daqingensis TaxID=3041001 RepID=UPI002474C20B|nr:polysaccharide deacetylase family protein [Salipaludibacillus daqingensis]
MFIFIKKHKNYLGKMLLLLFIFSVMTIGTDVIEAKESSVSEAHVYVDETPIQTNYALRDGHLLVPAIFFKETGSLVDWNEKYDSIVFRLGDISFAHPTGSNVIDIKKNNNWEREQLSVASIHIDGQTFVPLNDIAKYLDLNVSYHEDIKKTFIQNPEPRTVSSIGSGDGEQKQVALTFDDGPDILYTTQILEILKEKGVPATFFVVGQQVEKHPEMMKRIVDEGHAFGNHSFTHSLFPDIQSSDVQNELRQTQDIISDTVGRQSDLFRPPFGALTRADEELIHRIGFRSIMWSVDTMDWSGLSGDEIYSTVINEISPGGIVLQHNIDWNPENLKGTVDALPKIIDELQRQGYTFVTIQTLLE